MSVVTGQGDKMVRTMKSLNIIPPLSEISEYVKDKKNPRKLNDTALRRTKMACVRTQRDK